MALDDKGIKFVRLDGSTPIKKRKQAVETFTEDPDVRVFLTTYGAGGVGLNLVAANYVFLMDIGYNPQTEQQAIDRVHRIGQTRPVRIIKMVMRDTIEEVVMQISDRKAALAKHVLSKKMSGKEEQQSSLKELLDMFK